LTVADAVNIGRVAVTGAMGVNGVWVLRAFISRGVEVLALDINEDYSLAPELCGNIAFDRVDVTRPHELEKAFSAFAPEAVVHMAALLPAESQSDPFRGYQLNVMATANVFEAAKNHGVKRVVMASSKAAYGNMPDEFGYPAYRPVKEVDRCNPVAVYDYSKIAAEGLGINFARNDSFEFAALRFATIYGPGKVGRHGPMSIASALIESAIAGETYELEHGGDECDDYIYAEDAGAALAVVALHDQPLEHNLYNVGLGEAVSLAEYAKTVESVIPQAKTNIGTGLDPMGAGVSYYYVFDCGRMREEFNFTPRSLEAGMAAFVDFSMQAG